MSSDAQPNPLTESAMTIPSDSEQYSGNDDISPSPPSSSSSPPMILYTPPTFWGLLRGAAINLLLPFINGLMLGFGELFAHEAAFRLGWGGTKVWELFAMICCGTALRETRLLHYLYASCSSIRSLGRPVPHPRHWLYANMHALRSSQVIEVLIPLDQALKSEMIRWRGEGGTGSWRT